MTRILPFAHRVSPAKPFRAGRTRLSAISHEARHLKPTLLENHAGSVGSRPNKPNHEVSNSSAARVAILADTPNIFRSLRRVYSQGTRADYAAVYRLARKLGVLTEAVAFANDGVHPGFTEALERIGYTVSLPHAPDVDDGLIAYAVALHSVTDRLVMCSGDGGYLPLIRLLKGTGMEVHICAVLSCCSRSLMDLADGVFAMPVLPESAEPLHGHLQTTKH